MKSTSESAESVLQNCSRLLLGLPAMVAAACFAHGHGALGSQALSLLLLVAFALGALGAYALLRIVQQGGGSREAETENHVRTAAAKCAAHPNPYS